MFSRERIYICIVNLVVYISVSLGLGLGVFLRLFGACFADVTEAVVVLLGHSGSFCHQIRLRRPRRDAVVCDDGASARLSLRVTT